MGLGFLHQSTSFPAGKHSTFSFLSWFLFNLFACSSSLTPPNQTKYEYIRSQENTKFDTPTLPSTQEKKAENQHVPIVLFSAPFLLVQMVCFWIALIPNFWLESKDREVDMGSSLLHPASCILPPWLVRTHYIRSGFSDLQPKKQLSLQTHEKNPWWKGVDAVIYLWEWALSVGSL